jgi:SAM-dependent methyltransferase
MRMHAESSVSKDEERQTPMFTKSALYYDAIYTATGKDYEAEARHLAKLIREHGPSSGGSLLDVACGTGGHLRYLRDEFQVEGLDLDPKMLEVARRNLPGIPFHQADMADFQLQRRYDAVVCLFSSIGYCSSYRKLARAVGAMAGHAAPGGLVIIEPWFTPDVFSETGVYAVFVDLPDLKIARMNRNSVEKGVAILDFHYLVATPKEVISFREAHRLTLFTHDQYLAALQAAGLKVVHDPEGLDGRGLYVGLNGAPH